VRVPNLNPVLNTLTPGLTAETRDLRMFPATSVP